MPFPLAEALHLVSTAASHANDAMRRIEKFKKLLEVQEALGGSGGGAGGVRGVRKLFVSRTNHSEVKIMFKITYVGRSRVPYSGADQGGADSQDIGQERGPPGQIPFPGN